MVTLFKTVQFICFFHEKIPKPKGDQLLIAEEPPEISSVSWCKLKNWNGTKLDCWAYDLEIRFKLADATAQFVSLETYELLLFVLGQKPHNVPGQSCKEVLTLFNEFRSNTEYSFKKMLHQLKLPFVYDEDKSLAQNRYDFKDFFSCLTNIICAVIEGGHRCEAASRILQGFCLGDSIPLEHNEIKILETSTLFNDMLLCCTIVKMKKRYCMDKSLTILKISVKRLLNPKIS